MSATATINPASEEKGKKGDNGIAGKAMAATIGGGIAAAATVFAKDMIDGNEATPAADPIENIDSNPAGAEEAITAQAATVEPVEVAAQETQEQPSNSSANTTSTQSTEVEEITPVSTHNNSTPESNTGSSSHPSSSSTSNQTQTQPSQAQVNPQDVEPVNPEQIAQEIIAVEEIDPNDIDVANVVNVEEITTVYTAEGEMQAVVAHDPTGEQFVMIDIDNDNVMDVVQFGDNTIAELGPTYTMDDAELAASESNTYLAANTGTEAENISDDSIEADMISYS